MLQKTSPPAEAFGDTDDCFTNMEPSLVKIGVNYVYVWCLDHDYFFRQRNFISIPARVLHTTNSYYSSSCLLFFYSQKAKPNKGMMD